MPTFVTITHPELGQAEVIESALPVWERRGWTRQAEPAAGPVSAAAPAADGTRRTTTAPPTA